MRIYSMASRVTLLFVALVAGCGGGGGGFEPAGTVGEQASGAVAAAAGGSVSTTSGSAAIEIPAGALAADTTITIDTLDRSGFPGGGSLGSHVFEFGPDGTTFQQPVEIGLAFAGDVPDGKVAKLAWLDGNSWKVVAGSKLSGGKVTGSVDHFTRFVITFDDDGGSITTDDPFCRDLVFSACGGDPTGIWTVQTMCLSDYSLGNPYEGQPGCEDAVYAVEFAWGGTVEFQSGGSYTVDMTQSIDGASIVLKDGCLSALTGGQIPPAQYCSMIADGMSDEDASVECSYGSGSCSCDVTFLDPEQGVSQDSGTWSVSGSELTLTDSDGGEPKTQQFCVTGGRLIVRSEGEGGEMFMVLKP